MFDKDAILALQESQSIAAVSAALLAADTTLDLAALPSDYKLHNLEPFLPARRRARGTMATPLLESFTDYTKAHAEAGASVFVNPDNMSATAVLNLGTPSAPGHADNKAKLEVKRTAAFIAMLGVASGNPLKQSIVAEFLEDWPDQVSCYNADGPLSISKAIQAVRKITIESIRKMENSEQQLSASRSAFESVQATSADPIPTLIEFVCQPYPELMERVFTLRLAVQTGGDKPAIALRIIKAEQHNEEMARELTFMISAGFDGAEIPVLIGGYAKTE